MKNPDWLRYTGIATLIVFLLGLVSSLTLLFLGKDFGVAILILFIILPAVSVFVFAWLIGILTNFLVSKKKHNAANIILGILLIILLIILVWLVILPTIPAPAKIIYIFLVILPAIYLGFLLRVVNQ